MEDMHPEGMLDRDQRTAKIRFCWCTCSDMEVPKRSISFTNSICNDSTKPCSIISSIVTRNQKTKFSYLTWKKGYLIQSLQRLKHVLLVLVYLTLVTLPASYSAPLNLEMNQEWWNNPCNIDNPHSVTKLEEGVLDFKQWNLDEILAQASYSFIQATNAKDEFAQNTFNRNFDELFVEQSYEWLPNVSKMLGEDIPQTVLQEMTPEKTIQKIYHDLQVVAVGIQQIISDEKRGGRFRQLFEYREAELKSVLCELQMAMISMNMPLPVDIPRSVMPDEFRYNLDNSQSFRRNYIIYKEYINTLEYLIQALKYFKCVQSREQGESSSCGSGQFRE